MLEVSHLTKIYKNLVANGNLTFTVNPGEIAVLLGPNGAGKSTATNVFQVYCVFREKLKFVVTQINQLMQSVILGTFRKFLHRMKI